MPETTQHIIDVPNESKEVVDFLHDLVEDIRAGKTVAQITTENLPNLIKAIEGYDQLADEIKGEYMSEVLAYLADRMGDVFGK